MSLTLANSQNLAIHGYHDKEQNSYSLMENALPLLVDDKYSPFLITKGYHYTISTPSVIDILRGLNQQKNYQRRKNIIANFMLVPGVVFALMYIANSLKLLEQIPYLYTLSQSWIAQFTFWLSMIGVVILWHDYYSTKTHPVKFPETGRFTQKEYNSIKISGVRFEKYKRLAAADYLSDISLEFIHLASTLKQVDTYKLFTELIQEEAVQKTIKRAELDLEEKEFPRYKISTRTFPKYPVQSLRSLIIYALEEAIITGDQNIKPIHIFLSMVRVYPSLKKVVRAQDSSVELLREAASYEIGSNNKVGFFSDFDIRRTFYPNGGVGHKWIYNFSEKSKNYLEDITVELSKERERYGIGQEAALNDLIQILERKDNINKALIIGPSGIGKSSIVKALAQMINWGDIPNSFRGKRVIKIGSDFIINSAPKVAPEYFAKILENLDSSSSNIYYIDDLLKIIIPYEGRKTLSETQKMLIQFISHTKSPIITTIHYSDYLQYIKGSTEIEGKFEVLEMDSIPMSTTVAILKQKISSIQSAFKIFVTIPAIIKVTEITTVTTVSSNQPKVAVDFLSDLAKLLSRKQGTKLGVKEVISLSPGLIQQYQPEINLPTYDIEDEWDNSINHIESSVLEASKTIQLIEEIKSKTIGRSAEIEEIINTHFRLSYTKGATKGRFLIGGAEGSGKTHLIKSIIQSLYPEKLYIFIDLKKYQYVADIQKLLFRFTTDTKTPNSYDIDTAIVFESLEYLNPQTQQYMLEILQKGEALGQYKRLYRFRKSTIFATTRLGSEYLINPLDIRFNESLYKEDQQRGMLAMRTKVHPEILDSFDYATMLRMHSVVELSQIVESELDNFSKIFIASGFSLEWDRAIPQLLASKILEGRLFLKDLKEILHGVGNQAIHDNIHSSQSTGYSDKKRITITQSSLIRQLS